ncbi:MAG TPA: Lrp/AsnC family transcriptional regulator [Candidatus Nanoarchaeia archaeon]|nr:Lrp/AsnC family transcriptional regulator [Candidatus Nanoarchaeia archaeon]
MTTNKDLLILHHLRSNSRQALTKISRKTGIPVSTIFDRIQNNLNNLIRKNTTLINYEQLGYQARIQALLKISAEHRENAKDYFSKHPSINNAFRINNGYQYIIEAILKDLPAVEHFLEELEHNVVITDKKVFYIIENIKEEAFLTDDEQTLKHF